MVVCSTRAWSSLVAAVAVINLADGWQAVDYAGRGNHAGLGIGEMASIRGFHFSQVKYFISGVAVMWCTP